MSKNNKQSLKGGSFNLLNSRDNKVVRAEVIALLNKHDLDFLCVQEAAEYGQQLDSIWGYDYYSGPKGANETGILVKDTLKVDRKRYPQYGDGWITVRGGQHPAAVMAQVRIDGWLYVRSIHLPTPSDWVNGKLVAPDDRKDDYLACVKGLLRYFIWPATRNARLAAGDWNESPDTVGEYSPAWIANKQGAKIFCPDSRVGHGRIDYVVAKGTRVSTIFKDLDIVENSDHEPVVFIVKKG